MQLWGVPERPGLALYSSPSWPHALNPRYHFESPILGAPHTHICMAPGGGPAWPSGGPSSFRQWRPGLVAFALSTCWAGSATSLAPLGMWSWLLWWRAGIKAALYSLAEIPAVTQQEAGLAPASVSDFPVFSPGELCCSACRGARCSQHVLSLPCRAHSILFCRTWTSVFGR